MLSTSLLLSKASLKTDAMFEQIDKLCEEAVRYGSRWVSRSIDGIQSCYYVSGTISQIFTFRNTSKAISRPNTRPVLCRVLVFPLGAERQPSSFPLSSGPSSAGNHQCDIDAVLPSVSSVRSYPLIPDLKTTALSNRLPFPPLQIHLPHTETEAVLATEPGAAFVKMDVGFNGLRRRGKMFSRWGLL